MRQQPWFVLPVVFLLALTGCAPTTQAPAAEPPASPPPSFRLQIANLCSFSVRVYLDGVPRGSVTPNRSLRLEGITPGEHTLLVEGLGAGQGQKLERKWLFDQDREWTLCAR
ncbi:MAG: hypothetical protein C4333_00355 [Meiothermus sp.]